MHTPLITGLDIQHTDCVPSTLLGFFLPSNVFGRGQGASLGTVLLLPAPCPAAASGSTASSGFVYTCTPCTPRVQPQHQPCSCGCTNHPCGDKCSFTGHLCAF